MNKRIFLLAIIILFSIIFSSCSNNELKDKQIETSNPTKNSEQSVQDTSGENAILDDNEINETFSDWVLGTEYGIQVVELNDNNSSIEIIISEEDYSKLEDYEFVDIENGIKDILRAYSKTEDYTITFSNGKVLECNLSDDEKDTKDEVVLEDREKTQSNSDEDKVNLIFIHHSVGENWLNAGLNQMLNDNNVHVADTYYGWNQMGDRTDTSDWPDWFNDNVMPTVYSELGSMTGYNSIEPADGENTIIMFKSCYPNSEVGNSIDDEKEIYISLLDYLSKHPDKMFVLITPPPMQSISNPDKTRELTNWLVASDGWRNGYVGSNLYVFDFYNVLTSPDNHHMLIDGVEAHIINDGSNTLYYDSSGDDHPRDEGSLKAAEEFVPLLMYWYEMFSK